jgi:hypothetical protein
MTTTITQSENEITIGQPVLCPTVLVGRWQRDPQEDQATIRSNAQEARHGRCSSVTTREAI